MRLIALLATYNEERFIAASLEHLIRQGAEVYLIDNQSTDRTVAIAEGFRGRGLVDIVTMPRAGIIDWAAILSHKERLAVTLDADWFMHVDADEFHTPPRAGQTLVEALAEVDAQGDTVVNFLEFTFVPTREAPDHDHPYFQRTMHWYYHYKPDYSYLMRAWKKQTGPVGLAEEGGHKLRFPGLRLHPHPFYMRHYLCLSARHAALKYGGRKYRPEAVRAGWHGWRAHLIAEAIQLPSQAELTRYAGDGQFDTSTPRTQHFLASAVELPADRNNMVICVAGMHRSGTSMVARLLNLSGVYLGPESELVPGDKNNRDGYWENTRFVAINDAILAKLGGGWDLPPAALDQWDARPALLPMRVEAAGLINRFSELPQWGWKDPRSSLTWPFWKSLIPNLKLVICLRNPLEVVQSLNARGASSGSFGLNLWLAYNQRLLAEVRPEDRVVTHYASFFHDARAELRRLAQLLRLPVSEPDIERACEAVAPPHRNGYYDTSALLQAGVPDDVLQVYATLCAEAGPVYQRMLLAEPEPSAPPAADSLTQVQAEYVTALRVSRLQARLDATTQQLAEDRARYEQALADLAGQLGDKEHALAELAARLGDKEQALAELAARLADKDQALDELDSWVANQEQTLNDLNSQLAERQRSLSELAQERAEIEARAKRLEGELAAIQRSRAWQLVLRWYKLRHTARRMGRIAHTPGLAPPMPAPAQSQRVEREHSPSAPDRGRLAPKALFVSHDANRHGAQILLLHLLRWLKANTDIKFEILLKQDGELRPEFEALAPVSVLGGNGQVHDPQAVQRLLPQFQQSNVKLVYANTITNGDVLEALSSLHCPSICHVHELEFWIKYKTEPGNNRAVKRNTTHYIAASQAVKASLQRALDVPADQIDVVYEFVPTRIDLEHTARAAAHVRRRLALPDGAFVVGGSGTTDWRKGADLFVQLARTVVARDSQSPIHFVWLGGDREGPAFAPLQYDISRTGLSERLHFLGSHPNPLDYLAAFDVFALVSREDPFPLVNLEAASLGKPIVCFAGSGGASEFVDSDNGFVVPYLDLEAMAERILDLLRSPELRGRLGQCAAEKVRRQHDVDVVGPQVAQIIQRFLPRN